MHNEQQQSIASHACRLPTRLPIHGSFQHLQLEWVFEYNSGRIEVDAMLPQVDRVLRFVPIKTHAYTSAKSRIHILVYTKLRPNVDS